MHKTRLQMLAALGDLAFADAPEAAESTGSSSTGESAADAANGGQSDAQGAESDDEGDEDEDTGSKADDPRLRSARDEAYNNRIKAREAEQAAAAAAQERDALVQQLGKVLGLVKDDDEADAPDAEALARSVAEEQQRAAEARRELAVFRAAAKAGADPDRLLDSRRFLTSLEKVDPDDTDAVTAAVKDALASNPDLATRRERGASTADTASGPGGGSAPRAEIPLGDALSNRYGTK